MIAFKITFEDGRQIISAVPKGSHSCIFSVVPQDGETKLSVSGLVVHDDGSRDFVVWEDREFELGEIVTIQLIEAREGMVSIPRNLHPK